MAEYFQKALGIFFSCLLLEPKSCRLCRNAFAVKTNKRVEDVNKVSPKICSCEIHRASLISPGIVDDAEKIHYIITEPLNEVFDIRSGRLLPGVLSQLDKKGISVLRETASNSEFERTFKIIKSNAKSRGAERFFHSVATAQVRDVRYDGEERLTGVYDTAIFGRRRHADVMGTGSKSLQKERRKMALLKVLNANIEPTDTFRGGAFAKYNR